MTGELGHRCPAVFDWDDNGWLDVVVCAGGGRPVFFANDGGVFSNVTDDVLQGGRRWQHAVAADLDGDGDEDLAVAARESIQIWTWEEDSGQFRLEVERDVVHGEALWVAVGDFFGDSSLDVYVLFNRAPCRDIDVAELNTNDVLLVGPDWDGYQRASHGLGCVDRAYTVDGTKILILNGRLRTRGPVEVADLRTSQAPLVPWAENPGG